MELVKGQTIGRMTQIFLAVISAKLQHFVSFH